MQLNYHYGLDECRRAVEMIEADALILHLNALQEAVQPEGDTHWSGLLGKIEKVCRSLEVPVIAKEVGWGFSEETARRLADAGVAAIDVAGAGGTILVAGRNAPRRTASQQRLAAAFIDWGIPTAEAILNVRKAAPDVKIIASGGLRSGVDVAKCLALGSSLGGMASPFLKAAARSVEDTVQVIRELQREIQVCMFAARRSESLPLYATLASFGSADCLKIGGRVTIPWRLKTSPLKCWSDSKRPLRRAVGRIREHNLESMRHMLTYHMGWEGEGAGPMATGKRIRPVIGIIDQRRGRRRLAAGDPCRGSRRTHPQFLTDS